MSEITEKKLALFRTPYSECTECTEWAEGEPGYARISEWEVVQFRQIPTDEFIAIQLRALAETEAALRDKFQVELDKISHERGKLLSLTHIDNYVVDKP